MFQYSTMGAQPHAAVAPNAMGFAPQPSHVGAMVSGRYYDIVGVETGEKGAWDKIKEWGDKAPLGVANKWLVLAAAVVGVAWYGHSQRWF